MTNEEAKMFLDNLKVCIDEHPVVADWLVEIADRKTEPSGYKMKPFEQTEPTTQTETQNSNKNSNVISVYDEPQTETSTTAEKVQLTDEPQTEHGFSAKAMCSTKLFEAEPQIEPNLILPERMERGERFEVGETIVVMNRDDYYDLLCKSWKDESHTDTHDEAIKAMATLIKAKTEPQTETEIAKAIVHKMIDDAVIAEDAYPDLRQKMHDAVDEYEPQTDGYMTAEQAEDYRKMLDKAEHKVYGNIEDEPQTDCSWK